MNVSSIMGGSSAIDIIQKLTSSQSGSTTSAASSLGQSVSSDSLSVSKPSELLSKLQQLKTQDPEKFKQVMADIAAKLKTAAQQDSGTTAGKVLDNLAQKFSDIANGGDLAQLMPHKSHAGHHGHHGYSQSGQSSNAGITGLQSSQSGSGDISQVMSSILNEVNQALAG